MLRTFSILLILTVSVTAGTCFAEGKPIPSVGETYTVDKAEYKVVGSGLTQFEYLASGESLEIKILNDLPGTITIVPNKGESVKVDPSVPMVWVSGVPHKEFEQNTILKKFAKNKPFLLLEYIR